MYAIHARIFQSLCKKNLLFHGIFGKSTRIRRGRPASGPRCDIRGSCAPDMPESCPAPYWEFRDEGTVDDLPPVRVALRLHRPSVGAGPGRTAGSRSHELRTGGRRGLPRGRPRRPRESAQGRSGEDLPGLRRRPRDHPAALLRPCSWRIRPISTSLVRGPQPRMRSPRASSTGSCTSLAARRSPRISIVNSAPPSISSTGTKPSAMLFSL